MFYLLLWLMCFQMQMFYIKYALLTTQFSQELNNKHMNGYININSSCRNKELNQLNICNIGIITDNKQKCIKWKYSKYNDNKQIENTTICKKLHSKYYCATNNYWIMNKKNENQSYDWDNCKQINCVESMNICQENIYWKVSATSIQININLYNTKLQLLIFSYLTNNQCSIFEICENCPWKNLSSIYFGICQKMQVEQSNNVFNFLNLSQNMDKLFYIIPIINSTTIGSISELSFKTLIAKPNIPFNIQIINTTTNNILVKWNKPIENEIFTPIEKYQIETTSNNNNNNNNSKIINTTINNYYLATNLQPCKKYCFQISAINVVGNSDKSNKICATTKIENSKYWILILVSFIGGFLIVLFIVYRKKDLQILITKMNTKRSSRNIKSEDLSLQTLIRKENIQKTITKRSVKIYQNHFDVSKEKENLINEFKNLNFNAKKYEKENNLTTNVAKMETNFKKNRFVNILPFDQTRVILKGKLPECNYINASNIPFVNNPQKTEYIASQGPIVESISDFWSMIWEQNISIIVMLTRIFEEEKFKCLQYWPDNCDKKENYGKKLVFEVTLVEKSENNVYVESKLNVNNKITNEKRTIIHLHMIAWSDFSAPNVLDFEKVLFRFHEIVGQRTSNPFMIHCSAGVGRTGTFIIIDRIIQNLVKGDQEIDVYNEVLEIRKYRPLLVQRQAQYVFIHEFIQHFLNNYWKTDSLVEETNTYFNG